MTSEICALPNMFCADKDLWSVWAAWAQAIGSVLAIVVAMGVAWFQRRAELHSRALDDRQARDRASTMAALFSSNLLACVDALWDLCENRNEDGVRVQQIVLDEIMRWPENIEAARLPPPAVVSFLNARALGADARGSVHSMMEMKGMRGIDWVEWLKKFQGLAERIEQEHGRMTQILAQVALAK